MKTDIQDKTVVRSGSFPEKRFGIANNAMAFKILSARIYTDVPLAIVRELSTNAYDAHVDAGRKTQPFDVQLPNAFEPTFRLRDYGTGLSPDDVENVYTTYFESTRRDTNDAVGCMGLGSKSPFAYTDQFQVTSFWNGQKYSYSLFKAEDGSPSVALLNIEDTDEQNGIEIKLSVKRDDIHKFVHAAERVYTFFDVRPNLTGAEIEFANPEAEVENPDFTLYLSGNRGHLPGKINVIMGQVCYRADGEHFDHRLGDNASIVLKVDIGDCNIAASREELHYDDRTRETIQTYLDAACEQIETSIKDKLKAATTTLERACSLSKFRGLLRFEDKASRLNLYEKDKYHLTEIDVESRGYRGQKVLKVGRRDDHYGYIMPMSNVAWYFIRRDEDGDLKQKWKNRLKHWFIETDANRPVVDGVRQSFRAFLVDIKDEAEFTAAFGDIAFNMTDLPPAPVDRSGFSAVRNYVKLLRGGRRKTDAWKNVDMESFETEDACIVPRRGYSVLWRGVETEYFEIQQIAKACGFSRVYGISASHWNKLSKKLDLPSLEEEAKQWVADTVDGFDEHQLARVQHGEPFGNGMNLFLLENQSGLHQVADDALKMAVAKVGDVSTTKRLARQFDVIIPGGTDFGESFFERYPMLRFVERNSYGDFGGQTKAQMVEYINMVEESAKENAS